MPKVSLSQMTVEALMDLRKRVDETLHQHRAKASKAVGEAGRVWRQKDCARWRKRIERKESPAEIS